MPLKYFVSAREGVAVVALSGTFHHDAPKVLLDCLRDTLASFPKIVVLHMAEVTAFPKEALRDIAVFLRDIRTNGTMLRVSSPPGDIKLELVRAGLVSDSQMNETLADAVKEAALHAKAA